MAPTVGDTMGSRAVGGPSCAAVSLGCCGVETTIASSAHPRSDLLLQDLAMSGLAQFNDLPLELLPMVVQHLIRPSHLAALCLVNQLFYTFTVPLLYERVFIYAWHREGKAKVSLVVLFARGRIHSSAMGRISWVWNARAVYRTVGRVWSVHLA